MKAKDVLIKAYLVEQYGSDSSRDGYYYFKLSDLDEDLVVSTGLYLKPDADTLILEAKELI